MILSEKSRYSPVFPVIFHHFLTYLTKVDDYVMLFQDILLKILNYLPEILVFFSSLFFYAVRPCQINYVQQGLRPNPHNFVSNVKNNKSKK